MEEFIEEYGEMLIMTLMGSGMLAIFMGLAKMIGEMF